MPIITKPGSIEKNIPATITLNKSSLVLNSVVVADAYFGNTANWNEVIINYVSSVGGQKKSLVFDASLASPTASFLVSLKARDTFEVHDIVIADFDGGFLKINRSDLTTTDFDISFGGGSGGGASTSYLYYKLAGKSSWFGGGNTDLYYTNGGNFGLSDIAFKNASGSTISLVGASVSNIMGSSNYGTANLINGIVEQANANDLVVFGLPNNSVYHDLFTITMPSAVSVSKLLLGPQGGTGSIYNMPREFKLLGSNDNVNFTEVFVATPDAGSATWEGYKGQYREFSI